jgi:catechol 2,3-dioxygenase-like lactoylglutathione lyase family enzyme
MTNPIALRGIDHVVIRAVHAEQTIAFYRDVLGCTVERTLDIGLVQLRAGASLIDVVPVDSRLGRAGGPPPSGGRNMDHFCLKLAAFDESAIRAYLASHGIEAPHAETRYGADGFGPSLYVKDPEGNVVELKG